MMKKEERKGYRVAPRVECAREKRAERLTLAGVYAVSALVGTCAGWGVGDLAGPSVWAMPAVALLGVAWVWAALAAVWMEERRVAKATRAALLADLLRCPVCLKGATEELRGADKGGSRCPECGATGETATMIAMNLAREPNTIWRADGP